ncbi:unnamed protein product [Vitrella brassicaformis CCMP3155]|uniref:Disease resistance R13L4/SHOC-2-like LRR domain-containing protein n=1 Tax=Vitrella brassicaformis (strain CCMP3155) TaxID=1169540 RepID=A0A0G4GTP2_VITBC|nr:unnamed protein product [Vitrella brassicaformis CCMP3155]|eukprot:CEM34135.1 unnamed protein product [Vitrella brassicaformis CCMP3155]
MQGVLVFLELWLALLPIQAAPSSHLIHRAPRLLPERALQANESYDGSCTWTDCTKWNLLSSNVNFRLIFRPTVTSTEVRPPQSLILPVDTIDELSSAECGPCAADADAFRRLTLNTGLVNETEAAIFGTDFCSVSFIVCIRLPDGAEGYLMLLWDQMDQVDRWAASLRREGKTVPFPSEVYELEAILGLWIWSIPFEGQLTEDIGNLATLRLLALEHTHMYGRLPASLGNLTSLKVLSIVGSLQEVTFSGLLPPARLQSLDFLWIMDTSFGGSLDELANLTQLKYVHLRRPGLRLSHVPSTLGPNLTSLTLSDVGLSGPLSDGFGSTWPYLLGLDLSDNQLSGPLPSALDNAMNLTYIELCCQGGTNGGFQGRLPAEWGSLTKLEFLDLEQNNLTGAIPEQWVNLSSLQTLNLGHNGLSGTLEALGMLRNLKDLYLSNNQFIGQVPDGLGECRNLMFFSAAYNQLSGSLRAALGKATDIRGIELCCQEETNGGFEGSLPAEWGSLTKLEFLNLRENNLTGAIPEQWGNLSLLWGLDLRTNRLSGTLDAIGWLPNLWELSLGNNR